MSIIGLIAILLAIYGLASASGLFAEKSGVINLAINGGMIFGAAAYATITYMMVDSTHPLTVGTVILGFIGAIVMGVFTSILLGIGAINLRGDQVVIGTAINILAPVLSAIIISSVSGQTILPTGGTQITQSLTHSLKAWQIQLIIGVIVLAILGFIWFLMSMTKFGLRIKAAGENPHALEAVGISVKKTRYQALLISGGLMGLAGALCIAAYSTFAVYSSTVYGMGYIALAILILGQWKTWGVILGALAFSLLYGFLGKYIVQVGTYSALLQMVPYALTIIVLPIISQFSQVPKSIGIPYVNHGR